MALIIVLQNVSALADISDYEYHVLVGNGTVAGSTNITQGKLSGHRRLDGWHALVQQLLDSTVPAIDQELP